jgi:hypothetical protein
MKQPPQSLTATPPPNPAAGRAWLVALVAATVLALPSLAAAQAKPKDTKKADAGVIDLGEITVEGKVQKPQVFYVLGRSEFRYRGLELTRSFIDRILQTARANPF